jgi:diaminopimelate epimerase
MWIDSGVPHAVLLLRGAPSFDLAGCGARLRGHRHFSPHGTNVDLCWPAERDAQRYQLRTHERGVEGETLACGSGALAAAAALQALWRPADAPEGTAGLQQPAELRLQVLSGAVLTVATGTDGWRLRGPAVKVFDGVAELPEEEGRR